MQQFPDEAILILQRRSHLEPPFIRTASELEIKGDLGEAMIRGDLSL